MKPEFSVELVDWESCSTELSSVRHIVFVEEQKVPQEIEIDAFDPHLIHALATDQTGHPIGTGRLSAEGRIGRVAVLSEWRGKHVGSKLMQILIDQAKTMGLPSVHLHAQTQSLEFYQKLGFKPYGPEFSEAGIPHLNMMLELD